MHNVFSEFEVLKIGTMTEKTEKPIRNHTCPDTTLSIKKLASFESLRVLYTQNYFHSIS
ncbi:hypothetical protein JUNP353_0396 [Elizabethkingia anophelis]|nr:hypothetical protein JUNP353_0396 [Elizabethkingia anophelis]